MVDLSGKYVDFAKPSSAISEGRLIIPGMIIGRMDEIGWKGRNGRRKRPVSRFDHDL